MKILVDKMPNTHRECLFNAGRKTIIDKIFWMCKLGGVCRLCLEEGCGYLITKNEDGE